MDLPSFEDIEAFVRYTCSWRLFIKMDQDAKERHELATHVLILAVFSSLLTFFLFVVDLAQPMWVTMPIYVGSVCTLLFWIGCYVSMRWSYERRILTEIVSRLVHEIDFRLQEDELILTTQVSSHDKRFMRPRCQLGRIESMVCLIHEILVMSRSNAKARKYLGRAYRDVCRFICEFEWSMREVRVSVGQSQKSEISKRGWFSRTLVGPMEGEDSNFFEGEKADQSRLRVLH